MKRRKPKTIGDVQTEIQFAVDNAANIMQYIGTLTDLSALLDMSDDIELMKMTPVYPSTVTFLKVAHRAGILGGRLAAECHDIDAVISFLSQLQTMQGEAWGRELQRIERETVGYWAGYWQAMVRHCGGWSGAKAAMKARFSGMEEEYRDILNESYKQSKLLPE
jgi:hypothetical protein